MIVIGERMTDTETSANVQAGDTHLSDELSQLILQEGYSLDHYGNLIGSWFVDFRMPTERSPIGAVTKYCEERYAIERNYTVKLAKPPSFRHEGETLIHDKNEGLVTKETAVQREVPITAFEHAKTQSLNNDINRALELSGQAGLSINITLKGRTITDTDRHSMDWGKDLWLFCTAIEPMSDDETRALLDSLDPDYDHVSFIPCPRTFAQVLGRAYVEQYGAPSDVKEPFGHTINGVFVGNTYHRSIVVVHGPVVYVDDPYVTCTSAVTAEDPLIRTLLPIFVKGKDYMGQREYRFVIADKRQQEADCKIMPATHMLVAAIGRQGDGKCPMVVPAFDAIGVEPAPSNESTHQPQFPTQPKPSFTMPEITDLNAASPDIPDHHKAVNEEEPPNDFHETVGVYSAVAMLHEKIDHAFVGIAATQPERKPYVTSAAWYAERSIRKLCHRFGNPIAGISVVDNNSVVIDIQLPHWQNTECKLAVMSSGAYALTLGRKSDGFPCSRFSWPVLGSLGSFSTSLDERDLDTIANFEPQTAPTP